MKTLTAWFLALLMVAPRLAHAQDTTPPDGTPVTSAQVTGLELTRLSQGLQDDIGRLTGSPLNRERLRALASRIEAEHSRMVAATRVTADGAGGARVVFVVARMRDAEPQGNINEKYVVTEAEIDGIPDRDITPELKADLQALTGKPLDTDQAERLEARLRSMFPDYDVSRSTTRGGETGQVKVRFQLRRSESSRWLRFEQPRPSVTYHSDQGWGAFLDTGGGNGNFRVAGLFAFGTTADLIEEYSGYGVRFESRKVGTERLGVSLEGTRFKPKWRESTLAALVADPGISGPYQRRTTFTPGVSFAITRHLTLSGGVSITELEPLESFVGFPTPSSMANAATGSLSYHVRSKPGSESKYGFDASFGVRSGTRRLESDVTYSRSLGQAGYSYESGKHQVLVSAMAGAIDGNAPMFERFSLGDSRTLRGWDKYDISPAGGSHMAHASIEYRYGILALFLDSGSVWNDTASRRWRASAGVGIHRDAFFMTVGVPLNTDDLRAVFTVGLRFGGGVVIQK